MKDLGLSSEQVLERRSEYGLNKLTPPVREKWYKLYLEKFQDPLIQILCIAAIISFVLGCFKGEFLDSIGIVGAVFLATFIGFINEFQAAKKFDILNQVNVKKVKVLRDGVMQEILDEELVPGDIITLMSGEEVPADCQVINATNLTIDESSFTGESIGIKIKEDGFILKGSFVLEGECQAQVQKTGDNTKLGHMTRVATEITGVRTPLNIQLDKLAGLINKIAFSAAGLLLLALVFKYVFINQGYVNQDWMQITTSLLNYLMIAVALIVVAVPEGLPMAVTLSLAYSMKKMTNNNVLIRKMQACETLGAITTICTDKTGTLTQNAMRVVNSSINDSNYLPLNIISNSTAFIDENGNVVGSPTEGALILDLKESCDKETAIFKIPFDSKIKFMMSVFKLDDLFISVMKGAPEVVVSHCEETPTNYAELLLEGQLKGYRTLGLSYKESSSLEEAQKLTNFKYNGTFFIADPLRTDIKDAVKIAHRAGIRVKMITGDNAVTAKQIAIEAGICNDDSMISTGIGENNLVPFTNVFARTKPEDKQQLVKILQNSGEIVAMTGDGTNDAPALNHAHVGIAMNNGTQVAKEASDVILLNNSFSSIIEGVKWGRSLYKNIQHFILFQLTVNIVAVGIACVGPFIGVDMPFTVIQMLWVNLIMDTFAALALATEPANEIVMKDKPRDPKEFIITKSMWEGIITSGLCMFFVLTILLISKAFSQTEFFTLFIIMQWFNLFYARVYGQDRSMFDGLFKNPAFIGISSIILIGQILIVLFGGELFRTEPMSMQSWLEVFAVSAVIPTIFELKHWIKKLFFKK